MTSTIYIRNIVVQEAKTATNHAPSAKTPSGKPKNLFSIFSKCVSKNRGLQAYEPTTPQKTATKTMAISSEKLTGILVHDQSENNKSLSSKRVTFSKNDTMQEFRAKKKTVTGSMLASIISVCKWGQRIKMQPKEEIPQKEGIPQIETSDQNPSSIKSGDDVVFFSRGSRTKSSYRHCGFIEGKVVRIYKNDNTVKIEEIVKNKFGSECIETHKYLGKSKERNAEGKKIKNPINLTDLIKVNEYKKLCTEMKCKPIWYGEQSNRFQDNNPHLY